MKKMTSKKDKGVVKGAPSGFVLSLMIHAAAFLLAGMLVVFNVVKKEEKKFVPPKPVDTSSGMYPCKTTLLFGTGRILSFKHTI